MRRDLLWLDRRGDYEFLQAFATRIAQGRRATKVSGVGLDEIRVEAMLSDQEAKAIAKARLR